MWPTSWASPARKTLASMLPALAVSLLKILQPLHQSGIQCDGDKSMLPSKTR